MSTDGYHIHVLGTVQCLYDGKPLTRMPTGRMLSLWLRLLLKMDEPVNRKYIAFGLWPDSTEEQALTNLRKLLHDLRKLLPSTREHLTVRNGDLSWNSLGRCVVDALTFQRLASTSVQSDWEQGVALYKGALLPGYDDEFIDIERQKLSTLYSEILTRLATLAEQRRHFDVALMYASKLLQEDALTEQHHIRIARLHALQGNLGAARRQLAEMETLFLRELGFAPAIEDHSFLKDVTAEAEARSPKQRAPFVGREEEWERLVESWQRAVSEGPTFVVLEGEAGIGKTRLADEFVTWARSKEIHACTAHCYASLQGMFPYEPIVELLSGTHLADLDPQILTEISRVLPDLRKLRSELPVPEPLNDGTKIRKFWDSYAKVLLMNRPSILFVDDIQWADESSLGMLEYFLRMDLSEPLLILGTLRTGDAKLSSHATRFLAAAASRHQLRSVALQPLREEEVRRLVDAMMNDRAVHAYNLEANDIYQDSGGNPLIIHELLRSADMNPVRGNYGATVHAMMTRRLKALSPLQQKLIDLIAVYGKPIPLSHLVEMSESSMELTVEQVEHLVASRILRRTDRGLYDFYHDRMREAAMYRISAPRKSLMHGIVANALRNLAGKDNIAPNEIARHFEHAGLWDDAVPYYLTSAKAAEAVYAHEQVVQYCAKVIAVCQGLSRLDALSLSAKAYRMLGQWSESEAAYQSWLDSCGYEASAELRAEHEMGLANCLRLQGRYAEAMDYLERAARTFERVGDNPGLAESYGNLGIVYQYLGEYGQAANYLKRNIELEPDGIDTGTFTGIMGNVFYEQDEYQQAERYYRMQMRLANGHNNPVALAKSMSGISLTYIERGRFVTAFETIAERLRLSRSIGDRMGVATAIWLWGRALVKAGYMAESRECLMYSLHEAVDIRDVRFVAMTLVLLGKVLDEAGEDVPALWALQQTERLAASLGAKYVQCDVLRYLADFHMTRQSWSTAKSYVDSAMLLARAMNRRATMCGLETMSIRCDLETKAISLAEAQLQLDRILDMSDEPIHHTEIHMALWQTCGRERSRSIALEALAQLYADAPVPRYQAMAAKLGAHLDGPLLYQPNLPSQAVSSSISLDSLMRVIEGIVETGSASR